MYNKAASKGHAVAKKGHTVEETINTNKSTKNRNTSTSTNRRQPHNTLLCKLRKKGSPISGGIQPRQEDKGKDNEWPHSGRKTQKGEGDTAIKSNKLMRYTDKRSIAMGNLPIISEE